LLWRFGRGRARQVTGLVALNLGVNLIFFMTHPIFTPYYIIPIDMLSLWTLLFATLDRAWRTSCGPCGLSSTGQRLIAV